MFPQNFLDPTHAEKAIVGKISKGITMKLPRVTYVGGKRL